MKSGHCSLISSDGKECLDGEDIYTKNWDIEGEEVCIFYKISAIGV